MGFNIPNADSVAYPAMARVYSSDWAIRESGDEGWYTLFGGDIVAGTNIGQVKCNLGEEYVGTTELNRAAATDNIPCVADSGSTTVASGSNGVQTNTFTGSGTLNLASDSIFSNTGGLAWLVHGTNVNIIKYTGKSSNTLTGCTWVSGVNITMATGDVVRIANCDDTNPRWGLIEMDSLGAFTLNLGTAAANPIPPTPSANRVVKAAIYIPQFARAVDSLLSTFNGNAKIIDKRVIKAPTARLLMQDSSSTSQTNPTASALSILAAPFTVPANSLRVGDMLQYEIGGQYSNTQNTSDLKISIFLGNAVSALKFAALVADPNQRYWVARVTILVQSSISFKVNQIGWISGPATTSITIPQPMTSAVFIPVGSGSVIPDTTIDNDIDVKGQIVTSSSSSTVSIRLCTVTKFQATS